MEREILKVIPDQRSLEIINLLPNNSNPLEEVVIKAVNNNNKISSVKYEPQLATILIREKLEKLGLLANQKYAEVVRFWTNTLPILAVLLLGVLKIFVGISRHKPVGFLVILVV